MSPKFLLKFVDLKTQYGKSRNQMLPPPPRQGLLFLLFVVDAGGGLFYDFSELVL